MFLNWELEVRNYELVIVEYEKDLVERKHIAEFFYFLLIICGVFACERLVAENDLLAVELADENATHV